MRLRMSVVVAVVCLFVTAINAQGDRGRITGVMTDTTGGFLPGVTVTLSGAEFRCIVTNERGEFAFDNLLPGKYAVRATLPGFRELTRQVSVERGRAVRLTLKMEAGALEYDARALIEIYEYLPMTEPQRIEVSGMLCNLVPDDCERLGEVLLRLNREAGAVSAYERWKSESRDV